MKKEQPSFIPKAETTMSEEDAYRENPLVLAFVGDAVQTLYSRTKFVFSGDFKAGALHKMVSGEIKASAQAEKIKSLLPVLTERESDVFRRARNSKVSTPAKNATVADYKTASGFEAVIGYLYLSGQEDRLACLLMSKIEQTGDKSN